LPRGRRVKPLNFIGLGCPVWGALTELLPCAPYLFAQIACMPTTGAGQEADDRVPSTLCVTLGRGEGCGYPTQTAETMTSSA
jgi:hypothetical protein